MGVLTKGAGATVCKPKLVGAIRRAARTARRNLGKDKRELLWITRAEHGSGDARAPNEERASAECAARRLVRGSPTGPESVDH